MKYLNALTLVLAFSFILISCSRERNNMNEIAKKQIEIQKSKKKVADGSGELKKRYGTNPHGSGNPSGRGEAADGTPILYYQCINSQDICFTYYVANPGDGLSDLTAIQDSGVWYEATFAGSVILGNNLYEDRIDFIQ